MRKLGLALSVVLVGVLAVVVGAAVATGGKSKGRFHAHLNGYQEVPMSISTTGHGDVVITRIDRSAKTLEYRLRIRSLEGSLTGTAPVGQAHFHFGQRHTNGGVIAFLCGGGDKPPCTTSGTISGVIDAADILPLANQGIEAGNFDEFLRALRHHAIYANVHTSLYPGGEIRGQVVDHRHHHGHHGKKDKDDD